MEDFGDYPIPRHIVAVVKQTLREGLSVGGRDMVSRAPLSLNVTFVSVGEITKLNNVFRGKESPTDVLSFPSGLGGLLGDIIICSSVAAAQAEEYGHSLEREVAFLSLHGLLHLLGFDHEEGEEEMTGLQEKVMVSLGLER